MVSSCGDLEILVASCSLFEYFRLLIMVEVAQVMELMLIV